MHTHSQISLCCPTVETLGPWLPIKKPSEGSGQIVRMRRLICDFDGRTRHTELFVTMRLILFEQAVQEVVIPNALLMAALTPHWRGLGDNEV